MAPAQPTDAWDRYWRIRSAVIGTAAVTDIACGVSTGRVNTVALLVVLLPESHLYLAAFRTAPGSLIGGLALIGVQLFIWIATAAADHPDQWAFAPVVGAFILVPALGAASLVDNLVRR